MTRESSGEKWALVLGASCGTGGAIARALAHDPGYHIFGVHRGNHPDGANEVRSAVVGCGRKIHFRIGDGGTYEGVIAGAEEIESVAGKKSIAFVVHSLANASVGRLVSAAGDQVTPRQVYKTFDSMAHSFLFWTQELFKRDLLAPGAHILGLTNFTLNAVKQMPNGQGGEAAPVTFEEKRAKTLENIQTISNILKNGKGTLDDYPIIFMRGEERSELPFWNLVNGPIADALWHVGQVVSFRRSSGNPFNSKASVLTGTVRE